MSHIYTHGAHYPEAHQAGDKLAHYMSADFIALSDDLTVEEGRSTFLQQISDDYFPTYVFIVCGAMLRGALPIRALLQEENVAKPITSLMTSDLVHAAPGKIVSGDKPGRIMEKTRALAVTAVCRGSLYQQRDPAL